MNRFMMIFDVRSKSEPTLSVRHHSKVCHKSTKQSCTQELRGQLDDTREAVMYPFTNAIPEGNRQAETFFSCKGWESHSVLGNLSIVGPGMVRSNADGQHSSITGHSPGRTSGSAVQQTCRETELGIPTSGPCENELACGEVRKKHKGVIHDSFVPGNRDSIPVSNTTTQSPLAELMVSANPPSTLDGSMGIHSSELKRSKSSDDLQRGPIISTKSRSLSAQDFCVPPWARNPYVGLGKGDTVSSVPAFSNPFGSDSSSLSEGSLSPDTTQYIRSDAFPGHRDTLIRFPDGQLSRANDEFLTSSTSSPSTTIHKQGLLEGHETASWPDSKESSATLIGLPLNIISGLLDYLTFEEYKAARLTCKNWLLSLPQPKLPASYRMPREVLQLIYYYLGAADFDAARHTCRSWLLASLDKSLLRAMLKSTGHLRAAEIDLYKREEMVSSMADYHGFDDRTHSRSSSLGEFNQATTEEWVFSKRLATEMKMSPDWRGSVSGLTDCEED